MKDIPLILADWRDKPNANRRYIEHCHDMRSRAAQVWLSCHKLSQFVRDAGISSGGAAQLDKEFSSVHRRERLEDDLGEVRKTQDGGMDAVLIRAFSQMFKGMDLPPKEDVHQFSKTPIIPCPACGSWEHKWVNCDKKG